MRRAARRGSSAIGFRARAPAYENWLLQYGTVGVLTVPIRAVFISKSGREGAETLMNVAGRLQK
jgi:hypothetical protein